MQEYVRQIKPGPGDKARTGMKKIQQVPELILDVVHENTDKARTSHDKGRSFNNTAGIYQKIFHHDVLAGHANENESEHEKGKLAIFKLAVFIIENFLDDEDAVRSFFGES